MSQYGGPNGKMGASVRYLPQCYTMPYKECKAALADIRTEELVHFETIVIIIHQFTRNLTADQLAEQSSDLYYIDHAIDIWPQAAGGTPFNTHELRSKGDVITDLHEDMAVEQKAGNTYNNILRVAKDYDIYEPIKLFRTRKVVHYQRSGECLRAIQDKLDSRNFCALDLEFDMQSNPCQQ